jgi:hypothetical protein
LKSHVRIPRHSIHLACLNPKRDFRVSESTSYLVALALVSTQHHHSTLSAHHAARYKSNAPCAQSSPDHGFRITKRSPTPPTHTGRPLPGTINQPTPIRHYIQAPQQDGLANPGRTDTRCPNGGIAILEAIYPNSSG